MFCRHCGKELPEGAQFCPSCGNAAPSAESGTGAQSAQQGNGQNGYNGGSGGYYGVNGYGGGAQPGGYPPPPRPYPNPQDVYSGGWIALGFFFPLVGLILYLVWQTELPNRARACGKGALIGVIVYVALVVLMFIFVFIIFAIVASAGPYYAGIGAIFAA
ncbi:MAG TPA: zinc ribbon domain-containing protein [Candidatus Borkfalkia excrementipullorum]|nr:zinc ribbon domain-containing protein [Candidatus Borkfalkia excrementipullorum]